MSSFYGNSCKCSESSGGSSGSTEYGTAEITLDMSGEGTDPIVVELNGVLTLDDYIEETDGIELIGPITETVSVIGKVNAIGKLRTLFNGFGQHTFQSRSNGYCESLYIEAYSMSSRLLETVKETIVLYRIYENDEWGSWVRLSNPTT